MELFSEWLIKEGIEENIAWTVNNLKNKVQVSQQALQLITQALTQRKIDKKNFVQYLFGYYASKPAARIEDYEKAIDNYDYYERQKRNPQMVQAIGQTDHNPFELGKKDQVIQNIRMNPQSRSQLKRMAKQQTPQDESRVTVVNEGRWTFYTIPRATNEQEEQQNKMLYCKYGKNTEWCTADPDGTYYKHYVKDLDITVVFKEGRPTYQFGLKDGKVINLSQFMDVQDEEVLGVPKDLYEILKSHPEWRDSLSLMSEKLPQLINLDIRNLSFDNVEWEDLQVLADMFELGQAGEVALKKKFLEYLLKAPIDQLNRQFKVELEGEEKNGLIVKRFKGHNAIDDLEDYLPDTSEFAWVKDLDVSDLNLNYNSDDPEVIESLETYAPKKVMAAIENYLDSIKPEKIDEEDWDAMDLGDKLKATYADADFDILDAARNALQSGWETGTAENAWDSVRRELETVDNNGFFCDLTHYNDIKIKISESSLRQLYKEIIKKAKPGDEDPRWKRNDYSLDDLFRNGIDLKKHIGINYEGDRHEDFTDFSRRAYIETLTGDLDRLIQMFSDPNP